MSRERENGIILSRKSSGEGDDICSVFTKNSGKEMFVFKGLKKSARRARTASEPGTVLDLIYYTGRDGSFNTVSEFDILSSCNSIRKKSEKIYSLWYILELINLTTGFSDSHIEIFNLLSSGIETLNDTDFPVHFSVFFTVRYLMMQGILPDTEKCFWCDSNSTELFLEKNSLRASCTNCGDLKCASIDNDGTKFLNLCVNIKLNRINCGEFHLKKTGQLLNALTDYINLYYNISLKSCALLINLPEVHAQSKLP